jgi:hypothetical protein
MRREALGQKARALFLSRYTRQIRYQSLLDLITPYLSLPEKFK